MDLTSIRRESIPTDLPMELKSRGRHTIMDAGEDIMFGSVAGIVGKMIEYPFDTVKVRLQSQPDKRPLRYRGPVDCFQQSIRQDGFRGLYRGISAPLAGAALETSSLFFWEQTAQKATVAVGLYPRDSPLPLSALYLTGAISGAFTSFVLTPVELVKCKMQVPTVSSSDGMVYAVQSPLSVIRQVFRHGGIMGFWNGQLGTLIRETGGCAAWFGSKETVTTLFRRFNDSDISFESRGDRPISLSPLPIWQQAVAGAAAGVSYNFLFFPADTIKSRIQTRSVDSISRRQFWAEGTVLWKEHGIPGFYRGCGMTLLRSAPSSAFIFIIYDFLKRNFHLS